MSTQDRLMDSNDNSLVSSIEKYRPLLLRFALLHLRDPHLAEDVVQETFLVASEKLTTFSERSTLRTWLTAILKHKIIDQIRVRQKQPVSSTDFGASNYEDVSAYEAQFDDYGSWVNPPQAWGNPVKTLEDKMFWGVFEMCTEHLPENLARVFTMRELLDLKNSEICKQLGISATNCCVMLHRARLSLRKCLETHWFGREIKGD